MDRQEAIIKLNKWETDELLYKDHSRVLAGEFLQEAFQRKWKDHPKTMEYALHPESLGDFLYEKNFVPDQYDIAIVKASRYMPLFWHKHDFYEIVYILQGGTCQINFELNSLDLVPGDFLMIAPNYSHQIGVYDDDCIVLNIIIRSSTLLDIFLNAIRDKTVISRFLLSHTYGGKKFTHLLFPTHSDFVIRNYILDLYIELEETDEYSNRIATSLITILFSQLVRHYASLADMPEAHRNDSAHATKIMNYIIDHYADCTLESISQHLHFSTQYCSKLIKSTIGLSFSELLTEVRIQKAKNLLISTPMKVDDISEHLGYSNPETLIRVFKKTMGTTPSAYRKKHSKLQDNE